MTKNQAIKKSIKHWESMIKWVKTQNKNDYPFSYIMYENISENWYGSNCPLCKIYYRSYVHDRLYVLCNKCPLAIKYGKCNSSLGNKWMDVQRSSSWREWIINANKLLRQLKSLLPKKDK